MLLALLAVGLWVLAIAGGPPLLRLVLVAAMTACVVPLLAIPLARRVFEVQLPPANVLLYTAAITAAAIIALTVYRGSFGKRSLVNPERTAISRLSQRPYGAGAKTIPVMAASSVDVPGPPPTVASTELLAVAMIETEPE